MLILSLINCIVMIYILVLHLKLKGAKNWKNYIKVKSLILILMLLYELAVFWRYFWNFEFTNPTTQGIYNVVLIASQSIESIILFLICYFFTKKASYFLEDNQKIRRKLRITMSVAMLAVVVTTICQGVFLDDIGKRYSALCHTLYFILPNTVNQIVNAVYLFIGIKITRSIGEYNSGQMALIQDEADAAVQGTKKEIMARKRSVVNMWIIVGTISFVVTY